MKNTLSPFFLLLIMLLAFGTANAQVISVAGRVVDKNTGEGLPFVNVLALPAGEGTTTDFDGNFKFSSTKKFKSLSFSYLGYQTIVVDQNFSNKMEIAMSESNIMINEAVIIAKKDRKIPKDTAAIALYRNVTNNKDKNRPSGFDSYEFEEHTKIEFEFFKIGELFFKIKLFKPFRYMYDFVDTTENGDKFLPLLFKEKLSKEYYQNPNQQKTIVRAQYMTGMQNLSAARIVDDLFVSFDLYDNIISAGGKPFPSPFSTTGLLTYAYYLSDSIIENESKFYRLDFTPKNKQTIAFTGYAWIDAETFALKSIEFKLPSKANINFVSDFYVKQGFTKPDGKSWFMDEETIQISGNITKKKNSKSLVLRKEMKREDVQINHAIDPRVFEGESLIFSDSVKMDLGREWWEENRIAPLSKSQEGILIMSDSLERTKAFRNIKWLGNLASTAYLRAGPIEFGRFYNFISWNDIEGIRPKFGARTTPFLNEHIQLAGYVAYGTKDERWKYAGSSRILLPKENQKWHMFEVSYRKDFTFLGQPLEQQQFTHDNMFLSILRTQPLQKIMFIENMRLLYENEWLNGILTSFHVDRSKYFKVDNVFEFNRVVSPTEIQSFDDFSTMEVGVNLHVGIKERIFRNNFIRLSAGSELPLLDVKYAIGLRDFAGGDYGYHKLGINLYHRWVNRLGFSKYNIGAGKIFGDAPYPIMNLPIGNQSFYRNSFAYNMMNEFEFANDQFASFWLDHHFDGKILNRIPLINKLKFREVFIFKYMIANTSQKNLDLMALPDEMTALNGHYIEMGFGIENILKLARFDFLWRMTQRNKPDIQKFAVRFSISPKL
jgi:hypothetical protein